MAHPVLQNAPFRSQIFFAPGGKGALTPLTKILRTFLLIYRLRHSASNLWRRLAAIYHCSSYCQHLSEQPTGCDDADNEVRHRVQHCYKRVRRTVIPRRRLRQHLYSNGVVQIAVATLSGRSLRQTAHTHCASVYQAAKLVAALLRVAGVTACLAESNGSLPPGL